MSGVLQDAVCGADGYITATSAESKSPQARINTCTTYTPVMDDLNICVGKDEVHFRDRDLSGAITMPVQMANIGFKRLGNKDLKPPAELRAKWDEAIPGWRKLGEGQSISFVAEGLEKAVHMSGLKGVDLRDTMRKGCDYWRPGKYLREVAEILTERGIEVFFSKEDELCPTLELLDAFRAKKPKLPFPEFARRYSKELIQHGHVEHGVRAVLNAQARGHLIAFYCSDPYIPDYGTSSELFSNVAFEKRDWPAGKLFRYHGCHRFILCDLIVRHFKALGIRGTLLEVCTTRREVMERSW